MNIKVWCKSFLSIYNLLPSLIGAIDKLVYLKSVNSSNYSIEAKNGTFNQIENIVALTEKKINLINLKVLTDETLVEMDPYKCKLIVLRYIDNVSCKNAIKVLGLARRTYFRLLKAALKEFESIFYFKVLKNNKLYNSFKNEYFLEDIFNKIDTFSNKVSEDVFDDNRQKLSEQVCSYIIKSIKGIF